MSLLDVGSASASNLQRFYHISHKVACSHFSCKSGRAFRLCGSPGGFAPYAPRRLATQRRRARFPFGIYMRHVVPNGSSGSALGAWLFYVLGWKAVYRSSRNISRLFRSFFVLDFLYTAAAARRSLSTEWLIERLRFPLSPEAGDLYVLYTYVLVLTEHLLDRPEYSGLFWTFRTVGNEQTLA